MRALLLALFLAVGLRAEEAWVETLKKTPCPTNSIGVYLTEPVDLILKNFRAEGNFRGVVLCPSASDDLYFFNWGTVSLEAGKPSLWDALQAITNRTKLRLTFVAPFLLIHAERDKIGEPISFAAGAEEAKLNATILKGRTYYLDRPWDKLHPMMRKVLKRKVLPKASDSVTWHYYRQAFVGEDLSAVELLRAIAYGAKTTVRIEKRAITFESFI